MKHKYQSPALEDDQREDFTEQRPLPTTFSASSVSILPLGKIPPCLPCRKLRVRCDQLSHACQNCVLLGRDCSRTPSEMDELCWKIRSTDLEPTPRGGKEGDMIPATTTCHAALNEGAEERVGTAGLRPTVLSGIAKSYPKPEAEPELARSTAAVLDDACDRCDAQGFDCLFEVGSVECVACERSGNVCVYRMSTSTEVEAATNAKDVQITYPATLIVRALYDYKEDDPNTIAFDENDLIQVLEATVSGWWYGSLGSKRGWFPSTYCRIESSNNFDQALLPGLSVPADTQTRPQLESVHETTTAASWEDRVDVTLGIGLTHVESDGGELGLEIDEDGNDTLAPAALVLMQHRVLAFTKTEIVPKLFPDHFKQHAFFNSFAQGAPDSTERGHIQRSPGRNDSSETKSGNEAPTAGRFSGKRGRESDIDDGVRDSDQAVVGKKTCLALDKQPVRRLACHFHKAEPDRFRDHSNVSRRYKTCPNGYHTIKELKDHLKRIHALKHVCLRCLSDFSSGIALADHVRQAVPCTLGQDSAFTQEFIVTDERRRVFQKKSPRISPEAHWYIMWEILFPDREDPANPYQSLTLEERWIQAEINAMPAAIRMVRTEIPQLAMYEASARQLITRSFEILRHQFLNASQDLPEHADRTGTALGRSNTSTTTASSRASEPDPRGSDMMHGSTGVGVDSEGLVDLNNFDPSDDWTYLLGDEYDPDAAFALPTEDFESNLQQQIQSLSDPASQHNSDPEGYVYM